MATDTICLHALISGRVQGVGYRYSTQQQARLLSLVGWVRNLLDGRVEAMIQGDRTQVETMLHWMQAGPIAAQVDQVLTEAQPIQAFKEFEIQR